MELEPRNGDRRTTTSGNNEVELHIGFAIIVDHYGRDGFRAILLPPKGKFRFQGFEVYAFDPPRVIDIWEAKSRAEAERHYYPEQQALRRIISEPTKPITQGALNQTTTAVGGPTVATINSFARLNCITASYRPPNRGLRQRHTGRRRWLASGHTQNRVTPD
jgi:hypothetical protein